MRADVARAKSIHRGGGCLPLYGGADGAAAGGDDRSNPTAAGGEELGGDDSTCAVMYDHNYVNRLVDLVVNFTPVMILFDVLSPAGADT